MASKEFATQQDRSTPERAPVVRRQAAAPLVVGHATDAAEREADRVAEEVIERLHGPDAHLHAPGCGHDAPVARSFGPGAGTGAGAAPEVGYEGGELSHDLSSRIEDARGGGRPLDEPVRRQMESAFGTSLSDVRVHTDGRAADLNSSISARAFTTGRDIFFGSGEYRPQTPDGEQMLAHELAHTIQQRAGVRRIHRVWDIKANNFENKLAGAKYVSPLKDRDIFFLEDHEGDTVVVKSEDQPVGYGQLVGQMHKNLSKVKNVNQRKLNTSERRAAEIAVEVSEALGLDASWARRGTELQTADPSLQGTPQEVAFQHAQEVLLDPAKTIMVMEFAEGQAAMAEAEQTTANQQGGYEAEIRKRISDTDHLRKLGELTAVDLFMGNLDRFYNGNIGNWFYSPDGAISVIDNVDGGKDSTNGVDALRNLGLTVTGLRDNKRWETANGGPQLKRTDLIQTATTCVQLTVVNSENMSAAHAEKKGTDTADQTLYDWYRNHPDKNQWITAVAEGLAEGRKRLIKVFTSTRWNGVNSSKRQLKKSMKAAAGAARQEDQGDATLGGGNAPDYYALMKARAKWLQKN